MENPRKPNTVRRNVFLGTFIVLAAALVLGGVAWYRDAHHNAWGKINFQEYTPTYLPDSLGIIGKSIDAEYTPANNLSHATTLDLKLSKSSFMYERKNSTNFFYSCPAAIINETCSVRLSPHNQRYVLTTTKVPGQSVEQTTRWLKGSTVIQTTFRGEPTQPYSESVIDKVVDSLQPVTYQNLKVNYYDHSKV